MGSEAQRANGFNLNSFTLRSERPFVQLPACGSLELQSAFMERNDQAVILKFILLTDSSKFPITLALWMVS